MFCALSRLNVAASCSTFLHLPSTSHTWAARRQLHRFIRESRLLANRPSLLSCRLAQKHIDVLVETTEQPAPPPPTDAQLPTTPSSFVATEPLTAPPVDGQPRHFAAHIAAIVDQIAALPLVEVADLNAALKERLNLPDVPMMPMGAMSMMAGGGGAGGTTADTDDADEHAPQATVKTSYNVKLVKYDDAKKVPVIKEIKAQIAGLNLVQAKKFVESLPQMVREDVSKAEAEKLSAALSAVGGTCEIE